MSNYAFPLAISGTQQELEEISKELIKLGYEWAKTEHAYDEKYNVLYTDFHASKKGILGYSINFHSRDMNYLSVAQHGIPCIIALASARTGDVLVSGEPILYPENGKIETAMGLAEKTLNELKATRRPTFDEIVNWYAHGSIEPKVEQPEPVVEPTLYDRIANNEVNQVYSVHYGESTCIRLVDSVEYKDYPILVSFGEGKTERFNKKGQHSATKQDYTSIYDIVPFIQTTEPEPTPTVYDMLKAGKVDKVVSKILGVSEHIELKDKSCLFCIHVTFKEPYNGHKTIVFTEHGRSSKVIKDSDFDIHPYTEPVAPALQAPPTFAATDGVEGSFIERMDKTHEGQKNVEAPTASGEQPNIRLQMMKSYAEGVNEFVTLFMGLAEAEIGEKQSIIELQQDKIERLEERDKGWQESHESLVTEIGQQIATIKKQRELLDEIQTDNTRLTNANSALTEEVERLNRLD